MSQTKTGDGSQITPPTRPPLLGRLSTSYKKWGTSSGDVEQTPPPQEPTVWEEHTYRWLILYLLLAAIMFTWPWVFWGVVARRHGLPASPTLTKQVVKFPQDVGFFVTLISSASAWIVAFLFSQSVTFFARKWVSTRDTEVSRIHFFANWKGHNPAWVKSRFGLFTLVYAVCFLCVTPAFTALLNPVTFTRTASLTGTELDFSSTEPECLQWFQNNSIPHTCGWMAFNNFPYTDCLAENQLTDVVDSGRSNMLSLIPNNSQSFTFTQLDGMHFLGPIHGVFPIGANGIPAFDTIKPSQFDVLRESSISYDYTLDLQGLASNVSCSYSAESPIVLLNETDIFEYTGTCPPGQSNVTDIVSYPVPVTNNLLGFWACKTSFPTEHYILYLRGNTDYASSIGNITCNVSPVQPAIFPVTYSSQTGLFTVQSPSPTNSTLPTIIADRAVFALQDIVAQTQEIADNLVAQAVITYGVKNFGIPISAAFDQSQIYLRLYESMIQGLLDYEATYIRLIYSSENADPTLAPSPCIRNVTGSAEASIVGWEATKKTAAYLVPMTIINLTAMILLLGAIFIGKKLPHFDPTDPVSIIGAGVVPDSSGHPKDGRVLSTAVRYSVGPSKAEDNEESEKLDSFASH